MGSINLNRNESSSQKVRVISFRGFCSWFFGIFFIIPSISFALSDPLKSLLCFFGAIIVLPLTTSYLKKNFKIRISGGFKFLIGLALITFLFLSPKKQSNSESFISAPLPSAAQIVEKPILEIMPEDEKQFLQIIDEYTTLYKQADTELKKSKVWKDFEKQLTIKSEALMKTGTVNNWIGIIDAIGTNSNGDAYISIKLNDKVTIKTWNNSFSDRSDNTLIPHNSELYNAISNLKEGNKVTFSAQILRNANLREEGKVTSPIFIAKFKKIEE